MHTRSTLRRWLSPTLFAVIGVCFLLPFATVSCDGATTTFTGIQLVTRTVPQGGAVEEGSDCSADLSTCVENNGSNTATLAFVVALIGLALGLFGIARGPGWCALVGLVAMLALPLEAGFADVWFHAGYVLALILFAVTGVLHLVLALRRWRRRRKAKARARADGTAGAGSGPAAPAETLAHVTRLSRPASWDLGGADITQLHEPHPPPS